MNRRDSKNLARLARLAERNSPGVPPSVQLACVLIFLGLIILGVLV